MQRLVEIADQMDHELQRFEPSGEGPGLVFEDRRERVDPRGQAVRGPGLGAVARRNVVGVREPDVDEVPRLGLGPLRLMRSGQTAASSSEWTSASVSTERRSAMAARAEADSRSAISATMRGPFSPQAYDEGLSRVETHEQRADERNVGSWILAKHVAQRNRWSIAIFWL